jgi:hypothetical protein
VVKASDLIRISFCFQNVAQPLQKIKQIACIFQLFEINIPDKTLIMLAPSAFNALLNA